MKTELEILFDKFKQARKKFEKQLDQPSAIASCKSFNAYKSERDGVLDMVKYPGDKGYVQH